jgi:hypothetical protein
MSLATRTFRVLGPFVLRTFFVAVLALSAPAGALAVPKPDSLVVPTSYATIQSAIDAASAGATIQVLAGTYVEQLRIGKSVTLVGAGMDKTVVRAPVTLERNREHDRVIVDIEAGAAVVMTRLTIAGPGSGTCKKGALSSGVRVRDGAHLDFSFGAVRDIHDTPFAGCFHSANGILVGAVPAPTASLTIHHSEVTNYQGAGIVVLGFGSTASITHNTVTGPGYARGVATDGIEFPVGSVGTIAYNTISGNVCPAGDPSCGPDWFTQFQHAGITAGGWGPGTIVRGNLTYGNHMGMLLGEADEISDNEMVDNAFFGLGLFDGTFVVDGAAISGGGGGVWLVADSTNTNALLTNVILNAIGGPEVGKVECCGFTATAIFVP